jgi:hypothetical protein
MVRASSIERTIITPAAIRNILKNGEPLGSDHGVDVAAAGRQRTARKRWTGTATDTTTSPRLFSRTTLAFWPPSACMTSG